MKDKVPAFLWPPPSTNASKTFIFFTTPASINAIITEKIIQFPEMFDIISICSFVNP